MSQRKSLDAYIARIKVARRRLYRAAKQKRPWGIPLDDLEKQVPSDEAVADLIQNAFYASLETDEGRVPRVRMLWIHPAIGPFQVVRLTPPVAIDSPRVLAKMSQIVAPNWSLRIVLNEQGRFAVDGVCYGDARPVGRGSNRSPFPGCSIRVLGPADIEYQEGAWILSYKKGCIFAPMTLWRRNPVKRFVENLESCVTPLGFSEQAKIDHFESFFSPNGTMIELLGEFLSWVHSSHHGGTVAIVPNHHIEGLDIGFPTSSTAMVDSPKRYAEMVLEQSRARIKAMELTGDNKEVQTQLLLASMYPPEGQDRLTETYRATAGLANADGAVLLGRDLSLLGFGAFVDISPPPNVNSISIRTAGGQVISEKAVLSSTGTRHLSALRLAQRVPESIVFVFSADGEVRAFCREQDTVWYYERFRW